MLNTPTENFQNTSFAPVYKHGETVQGGQIRGAGNSFGSSGAYVQTAPDSNSPKLAPQPATDTVSLSTKKSAESATNWKKILGWTAAAAVVGGGIAAIVIQVMKSRSPEVAEKQLKQFIKFVKSGSVEDAQKFAKENFGIDVVEGFTEKDLDVLNWALEALTNASNKMKGKCRVPTAIKYTECGDNTLAAIRVSKGRDNGNLLINKKVFGNIDERINKCIQQDNNCYVYIDGLSGLFSTDSFNALSRKVESFKQNPKSFSYNDKISLFNDLCYFKDVADDCLSNPSKYIKQRLNSLKGMELTAFFYEKEGRVKCHILPVLDIPSNVEEFCKSKNWTYINWNDPKNKNKLQDCAISIVRTVEALAEKIEYTGQRVQSSFSSIYHEFGHLQDIERVLTRAPATSQLKKGAKMPAALKEWLDNSEAQKVAREVSWYSTQGPNEFIAEVFAGLMNGNKFSDDVMALYRKLHGPSIPGIE